MLGFWRGSGGAEGVPVLFRQLHDLLFEDFVEKLLLHRAGVGLDGDRLFFNLGRRGLLLGRGERTEPLVRRTPLSHIEGGLKHGPQPVVIDLGDRVDPMIVTLRAAHREPEDRARNDLQLLGDHLVAAEYRIGQAIPRSIGGHAQKSGGDDFFEPAGILRGVGRLTMHHPRDLVAGKLLDKERVPRFILGERLDHVVAIPPGMWPGRVGLGVAVGVGIAHRVEPVTGPALGIRSGREQPFHNFLVGVCGRVGDELLDLLGCRKQPGQVEGNPSDEGAAVGIRGEGGARLMQSRGKKGVDRRTHAVGRAGGGHRRIDDRLKRPVPSLRLAHVGPGRKRLGLRCIGNGAGGDPRPNQVDLRRIERLAVFGHLTRDDHANEQALVWLPGDDNRLAAVARAIHEPPQPQIDAPGQLFLLTVAVGAGCLEDWPHIAVV